MYLNIAKFICTLSVFALTFSGCAKIEYSNPIDPKNPNYVGNDWASDEDGDHIAKWFEPEFRKDSIFPVIELTGKNPDTIAFKKGGEAIFEQQIASLKGQFNFWDDDPKITRNDVEVKSLVMQIEGSFKIEYAVFDGAKNYTKVTRTVVVIKAPDEDHVGPIISPISMVLSDTVHIQKGTPITNYALYINVYDSEEKTSNFILGQNLIQEGEANVNVPGVYKVKFTAVDKSNNSTSYTMYFQIEESGTIVNNPPVITVSYNNAGVQNNETINFTLPDTSFDSAKFSFDAYDMVDGNKIDLKSAVTVTCPVKKKIAGTYRVEFYVKDAEGTETRFVVNVKINSGSVITCDSTPSITLTGDLVISLKVGDKFIDPGYSALNQPGNVNITNRVNVTPATVSTTQPDTIEITYTVTNSCNKSDTKKRTVRITKPVGDTTPPVITLKNTKAQDTVTVGTKYSSYKMKDLGNTASDPQDRNVSWSKVITDTTGFNTTTAGAAVCSLSYSVTNAAGLTTTVVRKIVVIESSSGGLLEKYEVPITNPLQTFRGNYTKGTVDGTGPNVSTINQCNLDWNYEQRKVNTFSINTTDGKPSYYFEITSKVEHTFGAAQPQFTLTGSGYSGLDGTYFIKVEADSMIWVEKTGEYAIIWTK